MACKIPLPNKRDTLTMTTSLNELVHEAQASGTLAGLPDKHLINGTFVLSANGGRMETVDPGTGLAFASFSAGDAADVDAAVAAAQAALVGPWRALTPAQRGRL